MSKRTTSILLILIIGMVYLRGFNRFMDWDAFNYFANGIHLWKEKSPLLVYPGTLFSLFTVFLAEFIFKNDQFSSVLFLAIVPVSLTIFFTYKICRMYVDRFFSISILAFIFLLVDFKYGISYILIQPYSDGWLLMFFAMAVYFSLKGNIFGAALLMGIAYFFRSQAAILTLGLPFLFPTRKFKKIFIFFTTFFLSSLLIHLCIHSFFHFSQNGESKYYLSGMTNVSEYKSISFSKINTILVFMQKRLMHSNLYFLFLTILFFALNYTLKEKKTYFDSNKIFYVGFAFFILQFIFLFHMKFTHINFTVSENRYFIYSLYLMSLSSFLSFAQYPWHYFPLKKLFKGLLILIISVRIATSIFALKHIDERFYVFDFDTSKVPQLPKNATISCVGIFPQGLPYLILKRPISSAACYSSCEEALFKNSATDFIFVTGKDNCTETQKLKLIWENNARFDNARLFQIIH